MQTILTPAVVFNPAARTLDLSAVDGFDVRLLTSVVNTSSGTVIFAVGNAALGTTAVSGAVLTLMADTTAMSANDHIAITYDTATGKGIDHSANAPAVPLAGLALLATVPLNSWRAYIEVQNQSAGTLQVVRDDGTGAQQSSILLAPGGGAGQQGGGWSSSTFKGRLRIYGTSGAQLAAFEE